MKDFCVVGSGVSGSTIASLLSKKYSVEVIEKAKGLGGRASNKRYKKSMSFDYGVQYISPKNKDFKKFASKIIKKNYLKIWAGNHFDLTLEKKRDNKLIGPIGNNDICKYLLKKIKVNFISNVKSIKFINNYWKITLINNKVLFFKNLILTCPYPQVKVLAKNYLNNKIYNLNIKMEPNITVMTVYKGCFSKDISSIKFIDKMLGWAANENSKERFISKSTLLTIQANLKWSKKYINKYKNAKQKITALIIKRFALLIGLDSRKFKHSRIHGWKYAYNLKPSKIKSYWSAKYNFGVCGDWFLGSNVEHAWLSANDLYSKLKKTRPNKWTG